MIFKKSIIKGSKLEIDQYTKIFKKVLFSGSYILGDEVLKFEKNFSDYTRAKYSLGVGNGTDALYLALSSIFLKKTDKVLLQANAGGFASNACYRLNLNFEFIDCEKKSGLLSMSELSKKDLSKYKVLIVTHLFGNIHPDIIRLRKICNNYKIILIEDCAQAIGSFKNGKHAGLFGDISTFSFYPTKNLGSFGDGGAIITSKKKLYERIKKLRNYGWGKLKYQNMIHNGVNSRLDELQAALLSYKLKNLNAHNKIRRTIINKYYQNINNKYVKFLDINFDNNCNGHLFILLSRKRKEIMNYLSKNNIETSSYYPVPDYNVPFYCKYNLNKKNFKNTDYFCKYNFSLPVHPYMSKNHINYIINKINLFKHE